MPLSFLSLLALLACSIYCGFPFFSFHDKQIHRQTLATSFLLNCSSSHMLKRL